MSLVVTSPFQNYVVVQSITDPTTVATVLETFPENVVQLGTPISPIPIAIYNAGNLFGTIGPFVNFPLGATVVNYLDGSTTPLGAASADINGNWLIQTSSLSPGAHTIDVKIDLGTAPISISSGT